MKLRDIIDIDIDAKDIVRSKRKQILRHALKKAKTNPIASKSDPVTDHVDIFGPQHQYDGDESDLLGGGRY